MFRQRATALATHLAYRVQLLKLFGLDGEAGVVPSLEAPFKATARNPLSRSMSAARALVSSLSQVQ